MHLIYSKYIAMLFLYSFSSSRLFRGPTFAAHFSMKKFLAAHLGPKIVLKIKV